jgi:hypothetical protein
MTATDLYEIVRDVPREAWPELEWEDGWFVDTEQTSAILTSVAETAFVGSMLSRLSRKHDGSKRTVIVSGNLVGWPENDRELSSGVWTWYGTGTSLVAALAAACKEVGNDG